ncbi:Syntaxin 17 [Anopheles darlingi]|uniref:Syntaxin 17 n=1 Tax=Anopheles darlingi TaxID=43151 RepID=W5J9Z8_ANODA|nr:Syntaxin 17 [Anopheles darlingi]
MDEESEKIPLKLAQISIDKFNQAIPQYLAVLLNHKCNIEKAGSLHQWEKVKREQLNAARILKQIKSTLMEIDQVRMRVRTSDHDKFDAAIEPTKKSAFNSMAEYIAMQYSLRDQAARETQFEDDGGGSTSSEGYPQYGSEQRMAHIAPITTNFDRREAEIQQREECLRQMTHLQRDMEDIQELYQKVHVLVNEQGESVTKVEQNVELAQVEVEAGVTALRKALEYKKAVYPLAGALLGTCIGGPIGLVVGLKAGGLAALGGGLVGFASGKMIKNVDEVSRSPGADDDEEANDSATEATTGTPPPNGESGFEIVPATSRT